MLISPLPAMEEKLIRCWNTRNPLYIKYHDEEWGVPVHDDSKLFEFLALGGFQAGLTWGLILNRREHLRKAFNAFDPERVARYSNNDLERILKCPSMIRNKAKISAAITNARRFLKIQEEFGSFDAFVWSFVKNRTINHNFRNLADIQPESEESLAMSKELRERGFKFAGPTICYAFMQATGLVNDHLVFCFRHSQLQKIDEAYQRVSRAQ